MNSKITKRSTTRYLLFFTCCLILAVAYSLLPTSYFQPTAFAQEPNYDRINEIAEKMNCPTCTGINLADCRTQTCSQWKEQIQDLVTKGYSDDEVLDYFVTQYGTQVLQEPPKSGFTLWVWLLPFLLLLAGGAWLFYTMRKWNQPQPAEVASPPTPSNPIETASNDDYMSQVDQDLSLD